MKRSIQNAKNFIERFIEKFNADQTTTLAASLAFYTALSLAPLLILFVTFASWINEDVQRSFVVEVNRMVGKDAAVAVEMIIDSAKSRTDLSSISGFFGGLTLLLSASLIFGELRSTLNRIFCIKEDPLPTESYWRIFVLFIESRVLNIGLALSFIFTMIVSLLASSVISTMLQSQQKVFLVTLDVLVSTVFYFGLFTLVYHYLPTKHVPWRRAWHGGALSALLFVMGKQLIGSYLGNSALGSSYGAAGSVVVLLAWVYYSALVTFIGAQISALLPLKLRGTA